MLLLAVRAAVYRQRGLLTADVVGEFTAQLQKTELQLAEQQRDREFKNTFLGGSSGE
jgi:hypothetical protein